jgi:hypothetical protein
LEWRSSNHAGVAGGHHQSLTTLRSLILHNIVDLPPVVSPQLTKLVVKDKYRQFTNAVLTEILGFAAAAPAIRELDLLDSPVSNSELADIMERCEHLAIFRVSSAGETRTDVYTKLTSRALSGYLHAPATRLLEVQFSHHPPSNNRKVRAREQFDRLVSVGTSRGLTISFDVEFYRLKVLTKPRHHNHSRNSVDMRRIFADNALESALITFKQSLIFQGQNPMLELVFVLRDRSVASRIRSNGLTIHGDTHYTINMSSFTPSTT